MRIAGVYTSRLTMYEQTLRAIYRHTKLVSAIHSSVRIRSHRRIFFYSAGYGESYARSKVIKSEMKCSVDKLKSLAKLNVSRRC